MNASEESNPSPAKTANIEEARARLASTGRNDVCPCGAGKKYKKCCLRADEAAVAVKPAAPQPTDLVQQGWRLFEQRRPGAAEKAFVAALALDESLSDARVGVAMAKLSTGDNAGAKAGFQAVLEKGADMAAELVASGATNAFDDPKSQPYVRAGHALGCMAYDDEEYELAAESLAKVYEIDAGAVGTEARLVASKALVKLGRASDAVKALEPGKEFAGGASRIHMNLALAHVKAGDKEAAHEALKAASEHNPHFAKAVLGIVRKSVDHPAAALPGSKEEAVVYAQGFEDAWDDEARAFLKEVVETQA